VTDPGKRDLSTVDDRAIDEAFDRATPAESQPYDGGRFVVDRDGVFFESDAGRLDLGSRIRVLARTCDDRGHDWGRLLEWRDGRNRVHTWAMPVERLEGDGLDVLRELARRGFVTPEKRRNRELLLTFLKKWRVDEDVRCSTRLGWCDGVYLTGEHYSGGSVVFQNPHGIEPTHQCKASLEDWKREVGALLPGNSRLVFAASVAFAGPLLELVHEESGGFHFRGETSSGKSTTLAVASSVWGPRSFMRTWRATANGLEAIAALHNDGVLILDELGQCEPKQAGEVAYMLANGTGKARASQHGNARREHRWRLLFLSTGEVSLEAHMAEGGKRTRAGQEVRMAEVPADAGRGLGVFEALGGFSDAAGFADALKERTGRAYGTPIAGFVEAIAHRRLELEGDLPVRVAALAERLWAPGASGEVKRVARRFAVVGVAGELGTRFGLTGWPQGEAEAAARQCFEAWRAAFGGDSNREARRLVEQVRAFVERHGASRFQGDTWPDGQVRERAGVRLGATRLAVFPEVFKREVCAGFEWRWSRDLLLERGVLERSGERGRPWEHKPRAMPSGAPTRVLILDLEVLDDDARALGSPDVGTLGTSGTLGHHSGFASPAPDAGPGTIGTDGASVPRVPRMGLQGGDENAQGLRAVPGVPIVPG